jgi:arylsulfatase A-like enzyme
MLPFLLSLLASAFGAAGTAPHITFFLVDDMGWNDVSMHGSSQIPTPVIDDLAATGIRLNQYYVNPVCSPTRASLMSGRSVIHHGIYTPYGMGVDSSGLNLSYTLLPEHLKRTHGYSTYMIGKVRRTTLSPPSPLN